MKIHFPRKWGLTPCGSKWDKVGQSDIQVDQQHPVSSSLPFPGGVFVGQFDHALDTKRRITIPSDWRDVAGETVFFVLPGIGEKCLYVFGESQMRLKLEKIARVSVGDQQAQRLIRSVFGNACRVVVDGHGRIRVNDALLSYAGIQTQATLVGAAGRFEIWSPESWKDQQGSQLNPEALRLGASFIGL